jgi:hypothetical protein
LSGSNIAGRRTDWLLIISGAAVLAVVAAALALRLKLRTSVDVAWLLTVGEKVLDGQGLYVNILETNPPASVLIYWPAILLARAIGLSPEPVLDILVVLGAGSSLWLAGRALAGAGVLRGIAGGPLLAGSAAILLILPLHNFAQREHIAVICLLPALAVMVARAEKSAPLPWLAALAGVGTGIAVAIKPHFLLAVAMPEIYLIVRSRSRRSVLRIENLAAAAVVLTYALVVLAFFPAFLTEMLPIVRDVYLPIRHYGAGILTVGPLPIWIATGVGLALCVRARDWGPRIVVPFLASTGFLAAFLVQGKGWSYHGYPAVALAFLAAGVAIAHKIGTPEARQGGFAPRTVQIVFCIVLAASAYRAAIWFRDARDLSVLASAVSRLARQPRLIVISADLSIGHPLVREIGGQWVARVCSQWITAGIILQRDEDLDEATRLRLEAHGARDRDILAEDIRSGRPDIILIHEDWLDWTKWALSDPGLADALSSYRRVDTVNDVAIWARSEKS